MKLSTAILAVSGSMLALDAVYYAAIGSVEWWIRILSLSGLMGMIHWANRSSES